MQPKNLTRNVKHVKFVDEFIVKKRQELEQIIPPLTADQISNSIKVVQDKALKLLDNNIKPTEKMLDVLYREEMETISQNIIDDIEHDQY